MQPKKAEAGSLDLKQKQAAAGSEAEAGIILEIKRTKENVEMKKAVVVISILVFLAGLVWFLQGVNILPGSYMTGDPQWAINGVIAMVISGGLFWFARRK